ncbi:hypothetical protein PR048_005273 [Dryococelus australis]|uniref:Uncharacterized protein n=1 Tax=Dryococelus australis TaxID=614101 RepID=A0ABQ9I7R6_9NEOP|nr:hypothetical protein PR048_005273 [Dryococelus australis]
MLPILKKQEGTTATIGDNLSSDINLEVLRFCEANIIKFIALATLPPPSPRFKNHISASATRRCILPADEEQLAESSFLVVGECFRKSVHIHSKGTLSHASKEVDG